MQYIINSNECSSRANKYLAFGSYQSDTVCKHFLDTEVNNFEGLTSLLGIDYSSRNSQVDNQTV